MPMHVPEPVHDTSDLKQRLFDILASISLNIIDGAVDQWRKQFYASQKVKGHHFQHLLN